MKAYHTERDAIAGWARTVVQEGMRVRIRARGFGHHSYGTILSLGASKCIVRIDRVNQTRAGYRVGERVSIGPWWLEGEPMH